MQQQRSVQAQMAKAMETPLAPLAELTRQNMEMWSRMQAQLLSALTPRSTAPTGSDTPAGTPPPDDQVPKT
jgi:polyhydroxyalkanoate synthesis regulator protein